jgi:hypothetical protein
VILIGVVMKVVRMGHHIEICSEMNKLNHLVKTMRTNKRCYFKPESIFIRCMDEVSLLGMTVGKNDPRHGGEDNLAKKNLLWDDEFEDIRSENKE